MKVRRDKVKILDLWELVKFLIRKDIGGICQDEFKW